MDEFEDIFDNTDDDDEEEEVLADDELEALAAEFVRAKIDDPDVIQAVLDKFEKARLRMIVLDMLVTGEAKIIAVTADGEPVFGLVTDRAEDFDIPGNILNIDPPDRFGLN